MEQSVEFQSPLYMLFVDYQRAFDSLRRTRIWDKLKVRGLPSKFINIIKEGYEDFSSLKETGRDEDREIAGEDQ